MVTQAEAAVGIPHVTESNLPQIMSALLVVAALCQVVALIGTGYIGIKVGRVVGQQAATDEPLFLPDSQELGLCLVQLIGFVGWVLVVSKQNLIKAIPKGL